MSELWYKDAVFDERHVKAFQDGNGDGIGDFRGPAKRHGCCDTSGSTRPGR